MSPQVEDWGYFDLASEQEIFEVRGKDVPAFLNKYITQDVLRLPTPGVALGVFLTQKGKIVSEALVLRLQEKVILIFPKGYGERVKQHLKMFLDLEDMEMVLTIDLHPLVLLGENIPEKILSFPPTDKKDQAGEFSYEALKGWCWESKRFGAPGMELLLSGTSPVPWQKILSEAGARELQPEKMEFLRITAGLPKMGVDMGEDNLVAEVGLDKRATSFTKGCYLGQETTARVNTQGHVNRKLTRLRSEKPIAAPLPLEVFQGEKAVGRISSAVSTPDKSGARALGIIQAKAVESNEPLTLPGGQTVEVVGPIEETK